MGEQAQMWMLVEGAVVFYTCLRYYFSASEKLVLCTEHGFRYFRHMLSCRYILKQLLHIKIPVGGFFVSQLCVNYSGCHNQSDSSVDCKTCPTALSFNWSTAVFSNDIKY